MTIFITGGAGFIGSNLVDALLYLDHKIVVLDNLDTFYAKELKLRNIKKAKESVNFKFIEGDIRSTDTLNTIFCENSIDIVVHLAAKAGVRQSISNPSENYQVNLMGTLCLLEAMRLSNVKKLIFASSSSVYGNGADIPFKENSSSTDRPISPYAVSKKSAELLCYSFNHLYNFDITCLRFFTVYGPRQRPDLAIHKFSKLILNEEPIPFFGDGETSRDYTFITDVVSGILNAIQHLDGFKIYNLGNSQTISLSNLVDLLEKVLNKESKKTKLPKQIGDVERTFADISKAKFDLEYNPKVSIEEGLEIFAEWFLNENINSK
nr:NAD-dependent epimerase/dehydratase family protein [uncultured Emticicia sp.]